MNDSLRKELFGGRNLFDWGLLTLGVAVQIVVFALTGEAVLSLVSGIAGTVCVVLTGQRKVSSFAWGILQIVTYFILCWRQRFYGEMVENAFYLATTVAGIVLWLRKYDPVKSEVRTEKLSPRGWLLWLGVFTVGTAAVAFILSKTDDTQPLMDAGTTVPAFIAQILLVTRYREQWVFWMVVDGLSLVMWMIARDWCMVAQYAFWLTVCLYGLKKWNN